MKKNKEIWHVRSASGAFYTLERAGHQRDFMKIGVPRALIPGERVEVVRENGMRTICLKDI